MATKCPKCHAENAVTSLFCSGCGTKLDAAKDFSLLQTETLKASLQELTTGSTFAGRYQVIEELGKGGMGRVYRVLDKKLKEEVALKLIKPEVASDKETIERFSNEVKLARKIGHRNVGRMYELLEDEGTHFITMEYVAGEDLKSFIRRARQLTIGTAVAIAKQVCEGLAEAHRLGVVHRDLKPGNIMIDKDGNARIMDFGIARSLKGKGITGAGVMIGTPEYMSPEQVEAKEADQRSDIYSLGVILYQMVTGHVPFEGDTPLSVAVKQKTETPRNPRTLNPQVPEDLSRAILRCLEKDKTKRYQTAEEVLADLEKIEKGIPTTDRVALDRKPLTSREITVKFNLKKLFIPAAIVVFVVAAVLIFFISRRGPRFAPNRIIVAVFENQTGDKSFDTLGRMASDWITQGLSRTGLVEVVSIPPSDAAPGSPKEMERIYSLGSKAGAGTLVSGSYFLQGKTLTFQARLSDLKTKKLVRALDPVNGAVENPVEPIDALRQKVTGALATMLSPESKAWFGSMTAQLPGYEAYQEYIEGLKSFYRWDLKSSLEHTSRAAELDPNFLPARVWLAIVYLNLGEFGKAEEIIKEVEKSPEALSPFDKGGVDWLNAQLHGDLAAQLRVLRQQASLSLGSTTYFQWAREATESNYPKEALKVLARLQPKETWMREGKFLYLDLLTLPYYMLDKHQEELKRALQLRKEFPESLSALYNETRALAALGKIEEINRLADESLNMPSETGMNPGVVMIWTAEVLVVHGHKKESLQLLDKALRWLEARPGAEKETKDIKEELGYALYVAEKGEEAKTIYEKLLAEDPENVEYLGRYGALAAKQGDKEEALRISGVLENMKKPYQFGRPQYWRACIAAFLGEKEHAVSLLRESIAQGRTYSWLYEDANMEPLLEFPAYKELMKPKG